MTVTNYTATTVRVVDQIESQRPELTDPKLFSLIQGRF